MRNLQAVVDMMFTGGELKVLKWFRDNVSLDRTDGRFYEMMGNESFWQLVSKELITLVPVNMDHDVYWSVTRLGQSVLDTHFGSTNVCHDCAGVILAGDDSRLIRFSVDHVCMSCYDKFVAEYTEAKSDQVAQQVMDSHEPAASTYATVEAFMKNGPAVKALVEDLAAMSDDDKRCIGCSREISPTELAHETMVDNSPALLCDDCLVKKLADDCMASSPTAVKEECGNHVFCSRCSSDIPAGDHVHLVGDGYLCLACYMKRVQSDDQGESLMQPVEEPVRYCALRKELREVGTKIAEGYDESWGAVGEREWCGQYPVKYRWDDFGTFMIYLSYASPKLCLTGWYLADARDFTDTVSGLSPLHTQPDLIRDPVGDAARANHERLAGIAARSKARVEAARAAELKDGLNAALFNCADCKQPFYAVRDRYAVTRDGHATDVCGECYAKNPNPQNLDIADVPKSADLVVRDTHKRVKVKSQFGYLEVLTLAGCEYQWTGANSSHMQVKLLGEWWDTNCFEWHIKGTHNNPLPF